MHPIDIYNGEQEHGHLFKYFEGINEDFCYSLVDYEAFEFDHINTIINYYANFNNG